MESAPLEINGNTPIYCLIGHPVGHSLSPAMQNAALAGAGLEGVYVAFDVAPEGLAVALDGLKALGVRGINVTIPHKQGILPLMDKLSPEAKLIGAVNTVEFRDGARWGHNTDAPGFLQSLRACGREPRGSKAVILGAGGSARAVAVALAQEESTLHIANRTEEKARRLAAYLNTQVRPHCAGAGGLGEATLPTELATTDLIINATPVGMAPRGDVAPPIPAAWIPAGALVYDLIYNPWETPLMRAARTAGAQAVNGAGMLAHQGVRSLEIWTGKTLGTRISKLMEHVLRQALASETAGVGEDSR